MVIVYLLGEATSAIFGPEIYEVQWEERNNICRNGLATSSMSVQLDSNSHRIPTKKNLGMWPFCKFRIK